MRRLSILLVLLLALPAHAATLYFFNGGVDTKWTTTGNWSLNSNNSPESLAGRVPLATDDVVHDQAGLTCTVDGTAVAKSITVSAVATLAMNAATTVSGNITWTAAGTWSGAGALSVTGNIVLKTGMTLSYTGNIAFTGTGTQTLTSDGIPWLSNLILSPGVTLQLADAFIFNGNGKALTVPDRATFDTNGQAVTINVQAANSILNGTFIGDSAFADLTINGYTSYGGYGVLLGGNVTVTGDLDLHGYAVNQRLLIGAYPLNSGARGVMVQGTVSGQHCDLDGVYAAPYSAGHVVVLMGDSITQGMSYGNAGVGAFILNDLVVRQAGGDYAILNKGISGDTADNMAAVRLATDALAVPGVSHVIIMAGTNDLNNSVSAADVETDLQAMYTAAHEAGAIVVAVTIPPREGSPGWDATKQAQLDLVNTWIMDPVEGAANVDYRIPLYATMEDPDDADALRAGWSLDKLHMTLAGYTKAEETEFAGVTWPTGSTEVLEQWNLSAITGGSGDCGTNSRITFTAPMDCYCVYSSQYWITADNWKTTSGGATPARMPLPQDTVYLDGASFDTPGRTFTANGPRLGKNINLTGITNGPTLDFGNTANTIYGSLTMPAPGACTFTSTASTAFVFAGKGAYAFTPNGASTAVPTGYTWNRPVWVSAPGGTLTISGQLTLGATNSLSVVYGTVNYQCQTVEVAENTKFVVAGGTLNLLNDTIWRAVRAGVLVHSDAGVLNMKNCILRHIDDVWTYDTPQNGIATFLTNDYFESSDEGGTGSITDDPLLVTEFTDLHLQAGSPCRNVGTDLGVGTSYLDPDGVNPDNFGSWEIGAYQFTAEGGVTRGFGGGLGRGIGR